MTVYTGDVIKDTSGKPVICIRHMHRLHGF